MKLEKKKMKMFHFISRFEDKKKKELLQDVGDFSYMKKG